MKKTFLSIRPHLAILVLVGLLPALGIILYSGIERREHDVNTAHERVAALARGLAAKQEGITASTGQFLKAIALVPEVQKMDRRACEKIFADLNKKNPMYSIIATIKPNGKMFASSVPFSPGLNYSDRKYFREAVKTLDFSTGEYSVGRVTKLPTVHYAYPILDNKRNLLGVVIAGFRLDMYKNFMTPKEEREGFVIGITDHIGIRLYRYPDLDPDQGSKVAGIGEFVSPATLKNIFSSSTEGTYEGAGSDGTLRIYAFDQLRLSESSPPYMYIIAGVSKEKALLDAGKNLKRNILLLGLTAVLALIATWLFGNVTIVNRLNKLVAASRRFGSGDLRMRTNLPYEAGEFGQLAKAFDEMASSLETREKALSESELKYRMLFDAANDAIFILEKDTIIDCNQKTREMFGCTREEIIGVSVQTLSPPNQSDGENSSKKALKKISAVLSGEPQFFEWKYIRRDGSLFDAEVSLNSVELQGNTYLQAIVRDITERIKTVTTLREIAEGRLAITGQGFFDAAVGFLTETLGARYAFIGAVTGSRNESVLTIAVSDGGRLVNNLLYNLAGTPCENVVGQKRCIYSSGVHRLFPKPHLLTEIQIESYAGIPLYDSLHKPSGIIVILDDKPMENVGLVETMLDIISVRAASELERMAIDKTLKESEELYRTLAEHSFAGVYVVQDGRFKFINANAASFAGYSPSDLIGQKSDYIVHPEDRDAVKENAKKMLWGERISPYEFRIVGKQKQIRWIMETVTSITFDGEPAILGNSMDITERKQAEEVQHRLETQLRQAQKMEAIGTLAGGIAHDFNNILTAMICNTDMAYGEAKTKIRKDYLDEVLGASYRAKDLISRILTFSRQQEQKKNPVQINLIVKEGLKLLRSSMPATIEIRQSITSEPTMVFADPTQIYQILLNLCTNAADAMLEKGGTLDVQLYHVSLSLEEKPQVHGLKPGNYAKLTVADTGRGIDPAIIDRIFDPFFTTKAPGKGTGLGLSVVYGIVKDHNGAVDVSSIGEGGTSFSVYLPLLKFIEKEEEKDDEPLQSGVERILFVDDEPSLVNTGKQVLSSLGYKVTAMKTGIEALEAFHANPDAFDLVITDMIMPGMTGSDLAAIMLEIRPDIPIILSTGFSESITEEKVKSLGIRRLMMKPFSKKSIAKVVRETLDNTSKTT